MMNALNLQLCKYFSFIFFPMSLLLAQRETTFQLTYFHISVIQYLHFLHLFSFLSISCGNNPSQKNRPYKLMRKKSIILE